MNPKRSLTRYALVAFSILALGACGTQPTRPDRPAAASPQVSPEDQVKLRAINRWDLLIERDFPAAYAFLSPGYRETQSSADYVKTMKNRPVQWTRVLFQSAKCEPEVCTVDIQVNAQFQMPVMRTGTVTALSVVTENWILSDGEWYLVPQADH